MTATLAMDRSERHKDQDGHLHVRRTNLTKATVNPYYGREIPGAQGLGLEPDKVYHLLRHPDELKKAADTFNNIRLLSKHIAVSADNPQEQFVAGSTGTDADFDGEYLTNSLVVWRAEDIAGIEAGDKVELSCQYYYRPDMTPGNFKGLHYDGIMRDIRGNGVALVEAGRAGPDVLVADEGIGFMPRPLTSRVALLASGALRAYLKPKLVPGTVLALDSALASVNASNWKTEKGRVFSAVEALATPVLAADAKISAMDLKRAMDWLDEEEDEEAMDDDLEAMDAAEVEAEKEARAKDRKAGMDAAACIKAAKDRRGARDEKRAKDKKAADKAAKDAARARDKAKDKEPDDEDVTEEERAEDKAAMDAAIAKAVGKVKADMTAAAEARQVVRPIIGEVAIAMDSAPDIYKLALDAHKIDTTGVHPSAFAAMVRMIPPPGAAPRPRLAFDSSAGTAGEMFPQLARIGRG